MRYLLDTSVCVAALRAQGLALTRLADIGSGEVAVSAMTLAELWFGALGARAPEAAADAVTRFLSPILVLPFDDDAALRHAQTRRALESRGTPIGERDLVIAATALAHGLTVVTNNTSELARVPGLVVGDWSR